MDTSLMHIFSSPSQTRVLEIVFSHPSPVNLRRIADLSPFTPRAVQMALRSLLRKKLLKRFRAGQFHLYSPNESSPEVGLIRHVLRAKVAYVRPSEEKYFIQKLDEALSLSTGADRMRFPKLLLPDRALVFEAVLRALRDQDRAVVVSGALSYALYRDEVRAFAEFNFACDVKPKAAFVQDIKTQGSSLAPDFSVKAKEDKGTLLLTFTRREKLLFSFSFKEMSSALSCREISHPRFGKLSVLTAEEALFSLCACLKKDKTDFMSLDDLQSIFRAGPTVDLASLSGLFAAHNVGVPEEVLGAASREAKKLSKYLLGRSRIRLEEALH